MKQAQAQSTFINGSRHNTGSAMIISIIFSTIITVGITALMPMAFTDWKLTSRTSGLEAAFSLAESGVEEAIWGILEHGSEDTDWEADGWTESNNQAYWYKEWKLSDYSKLLGHAYDLDEGREGKYRVIVEKVESSTVNIISQGIIEGGANVENGYQATRYIETQFKRPNPFEEGLISRLQLSFSGQPSFSSFHSGEDAWLGATWKTVASSPFRENVTVGSISTDASNVSPGNAKIYGDIAIGAADDGTDIQGGASVSGDIIFEFEMDLPDVTTPTTTGIGWNTTL